MTDPIPFFVYHEEVLRRRAERLLPKSKVIEVRLTEGGDLEVCYSGPYRPETAVKYWQGKLEGPEGPYDVRPVRW